MKKVLIEYDKAGAEWVCVAYLSGDANMLDVVERGVDPHARTGQLISEASLEFIQVEHKAVGSHTDPDTIETIRANLDIPEGIFLPRNMSIRQMGKKTNHGLNYDMQYRRFALENEMAERESEKIVHLYKHQAYPGISSWHQWIRDKLAKDRILINCFGRKIEFRDAWGPQLFDSAYSFLPQSTVYDITRIGMIKLWEYEGDTSDAELLTQVHDSILLQHTADAKRLTPIIQKITLDFLNPEMYYNGRHFRIGTDVKMGFDWGHMVPVELTPDLPQLQKNITTVLESLNGITEV